MEKTWTVVHFQMDDSVEAVPSGWLYNNQCYWPPYANEKIYKFIRNNEKPNTCWPLLDIKIFRNSTYSDYLTARNKARKAEETSDLNSDADKSNRKKIAAKVLSSSDSDTDNPSANKLSEVPNPPVFKKLNPTNMEKGSNSKKTVSRNLGDLEFQNFSSSSSVASCVTEKADENICVCCKQHPGRLMGDIVRKQGIMQQFLKQISDAVDDIKIKLDSISVLSPEVSLPKTGHFLKKFDFPLNDEEELNKFEEYLREDDNYKEVVNDVSKLGGNNIYEFLRRALSLCISNRLAEGFTYFGKKGKKNFSKLKINDVLIEAAHSQNNTTNKDIETNIRKWLRRAKERK